MPSPLSPTHCAPALAHPPQGIGKATWTSGVWAAAGRHQLGEGCIGGPTKLEPEAVPSDVVGAAPVGHCTQQAVLAGHKGGAPQEGAIRTAGPVFKAHAEVPQGQLIRAGGALGGGEAAVVGRVCPGDADGAVACGGAGEGRQVGLAGVGEVSAVAGVGWEGVVGREMPSTCTWQRLLPVGHHTQVLSTVRHCCVCGG